MQSEDRISPKCRFFIRSWLPYDFEQFLFRPLLVQAMVSSPTLRTALLPFAQPLTLQIAFTALSNGCSSIEQRLARWLLMADDRTDKSCFAITYDLLALILCLRRQGVTLALQALVGSMSLNHAATRWSSSIGTGWLPSLGADTASANSNMSVGRRHRCRCVQCRH